MAASIRQELNTMQSATAVAQAKEQQKNGASQELDGDAFLMLMLEQLKHQDPMNPMDNNEMLAQQAQFTQLQEMQKMNETLNTNNMIQQANSLVGKTVQLIDPNNSARTITGVVTSANFTGDTATITVNGQEYPLGLVAAVTDGANATDSDTLNNKKLSELNNASGITNGYIFLTRQDKNFQKHNTEIKISQDMTVSELRKEIEKTGVKTTLENGILTIEKGDNYAVGLTQGKINNVSGGSNILQVMQMFQNEAGNVESTVLDFNRNK